MSVVMQAPVGVTSITLPSGNTYTANASNQVSAQNSDVAALLQFGFSAVSGPASFQTFPRNLIEGGDFSVNPFQRNIQGIWSSSGVSAAIGTTPTYFADRFFMTGAASANVYASVVADVSVPGFTQSLNCRRFTGSAVTTIYIGQVLESAKAVSCQGQQVTLSFWAKSGANYSGGALAAAVVSGTGSGQSAANLVAGSWTGQASSVSGSATLSATMTKYTFTGNIPAAATELGVLLSWTPTGTAGADDSVTINGVQLEIGAGSSFEHRPAAVEAALCLRYAYVIAEPAAGIAVASGMNTSASAQLIQIDAPVQMRAVPTLTIGAGTWKTNQAGTATAVTLASGTHTPFYINVTGNSAGVAGQATLLIGGGGTGYIVASADF